MTSVLEAMKGVPTWVVGLLSTVASAGLTAGIIYTTMDLSIEVLQKDVAKIREQMEKDDTDARQWVRINGVDTRLVIVENKTLAITPESMQEWGQVKEMVKRHDRWIEQHSN